MSDQPPPSLHPEEWQLAQRLLAEAFGKDARLTASTTVMKKPSLTIARLSVA
jgi:hypothetical protein